MNIAIINSKGGVGKSTISMQIAATYLYQSTAKVVNHFEFDDENRDNLSFENSNIVKINTQEVEKSNLRENLTDILLENNNVVIDVGGNKTTVYFIRALLESGMNHNIDLFIIPLMDGESDAISAIKIYNIVREASANTPVLFALNRVQQNADLKKQFNIFLGDERGIFNDEGIIESVKEDDRNMIAIEDNEVIKYSKNFGLTIFELANINRDLDREVKEAIENRASSQDIKILSFKKGVKDDCNEYLENTLEPIFKQLDLLLKPTSYQRRQPVL